MSIQSPNVIGFPSKFKHDVVKQIVRDAVGDESRGCWLVVVPISPLFPIVEVVGWGGVKNHANVSTWIKNSTARLAKIF